MSLSLTRRPEVVRQEVREDPARRVLLRQATAELLTAVEGFIGRYVVLPDEAASTEVALYVLHTWTTGAADATPYLVVVSAERGSGKTRLLEVLALLVRRAWHTAWTTEAALFRKIHRDEPTLLLDEIDTVFNGTSRTEPLRAILNAGNRRGSTVTRCDGDGTREFSTFGAKVLAGIDTGALPETVLDRSIVVRMQKRASEPIERFRPRLAQGEAEPLVRTLEMWSLVVMDELARLAPALPEGVSDRAIDGWEPLLAISEFAGSGWKDRARRAQLAGVSSPALQEAPSNGLLRGMADVMGVTA